MERNSQKSGLTSLILLVATGIATLAVSLYSGLLSGYITTAFLVLGVLVAAVGWFQSRMEERERIERLEFDEVTKGGAAGSSLFNAQEAEAFPARRAREQFEKFFVPGFTILLMLLEAVACWCLWRFLDRQPAGALVQQPLVAMAILSIAGLVCFLIGKFSAGVARLEKLRLLNPAASHLLLGAYLLALVVAAVALFQAGFPAGDRILARGLLVFLALLAIENALTLLLEIYRPRLKGRATRLLYESRIVGLVSHPEDIFKTAAHALDYQFGFKVSETWFYQFLQRSFGWLLLAQLVILMASTCLVFIETGEGALFERWGRPVNGGQVFGPGIHGKLPWPITRVFRYRTDQIQSLNIGAGEEAHEDEDAHGSVVLWTVSHIKDEFNLIVASRESPDLTATNSATGRRAPPVSLLSAAIPVYYQISDLKAWVYNNADSARLLKAIATREAVRYLAGADVNELISTARFAAGEELRKRIQARAEERQLGVEIKFVGFADVHPPVAVGAAYERVVSASQKREAEILKARAYAIRTNGLATVQALKLKSQAEAQSVGKILGAAATTALFTNQVAAFRSSPDVYAQRARLQILAQAGAASRKYVLVTTNTQDVIMLNMEEKISNPILRAPLPAPVK